MRPVISYDPLGPRIAILCLGDGVLWGTGVWDGAVNRSLTLSNPPLVFSCFPSPGNSLANSVTVVGVVLSLDIRGSLTL